MLALFLLILAAVILLFRDAQSKTKFAPVPFLMDPRKTIRVPTAQSYVVLSPNATWKVGEETRK